MCYYAFNLKNYLVNLHVVICIYTLLCFFKRFDLLIFRERGRERERKGEKHQCLVVPRVPPHQGVGLQPRQVLWPGINQRPFVLHSGVCSTEQHQPGLTLFLELILGVEERRD